MIRHRLIKLGSTTTAKHCGNCPQLYNPNGFGDATCKRDPYQHHMRGRERWTSLGAVYDFERTYECIEEGELAEKAMLEKP